MSDLLISLNKGHITDAGWEWLLHDLKYADRLVPPMAGGSGTFSGFAQSAILEHLTGRDNAAWANLSPVFLALCTSVPDSVKTGSTIVEAGYTGYGRASLANTAWSANGGQGSAGAGAQTTIANSGTITFAACTAGSSTVIGWALCSAVTTGNALAWGSCSSTVISTTQTPATVASGALVLGLT